MLLRSGEKGVFALYYKDFPHTPMTDAAFTAAIRAMKGLPPHMADYFVRISPSLQDAERAQVLERLMPLDAEMVANREEAGKTVDAAAAELAVLDRQAQDPTGSPLPGNDGAEPDGSSLRP